TQHAIEIHITEVHRRCLIRLPLAGCDCCQIKPRGREREPAVLLLLQVCTLESITGQLVRFIGLIDEAGHGKTRGDVRHRDARAINETPIDVRAVAELRQVALSFGEYFEERTAWWF